MPIRLAMKPGSVLAAHDRLAEREIGEPFNGGERLGARRRSRHHLEQAKVAGRVEEMGDQEITGETLGQSFR